MRITRDDLVRWTLLLDAVVVSSMGMAYWGSWTGPIDALGIQLPPNFDGDLAPWRAVSMSGLFGGALLLSGAALFVLSRSRDRERVYLGIPALIAGHGLLGFIAFAKVTAFDFPDAAHWLVIGLVLPIVPLGAGLLLSPEVGISPGTSWERQLRAEARSVERVRLARDLHDSVKQEIYAVDTQLATTLARWDRDPAGARLALSQARASTQDAMTQIAALLDGLCAEPRESTGFVDGLRHQCEVLTLRTGARVVVDVGEIPRVGRVASDVMTNLFWMVQEALSNVARHSGAKLVYVGAGLEATHGHEQFVVSIHDDGIGFDVEAQKRAPSASLGLRGLGTRAREMGAALAIASQSGEGTRIEVRVPVQPDGHGICSRVFVSALCPMLAGMLWMLSWPEWSPYLRPFILGLAAVCLASGAWFAFTWRFR